jgi:hypothetical protein
MTEEHLFLGLMVEGAVSLACISRQLQQRFMEVLSCSLSYPAD